MQELVTWSRDRTLRVWKIDEMMLRLCEPDSDHLELDHEPYSSIETPSKFQPLLSSSLQRPNIIIRRQPPNSLPVTEAIDALHIPTPRSPPHLIVRNREDSQTARSLTDKPTCSLHHEFSLLNTNIPGVEVDVLDAFKRNAIFKISAAGHTVLLQVV